MKTPGRYYFLLMASCFLFANAGFSQEAVIEEWPGTLKREGKQKESVTFQVRISDNGPFILGMTYADTPFEFKKQEHKKNSTKFDWTPGENDASCRLRKGKSGVFEGECELENSTKKIKMQIMPQGKKALAADPEAPAAGSKASEAASKKGGKADSKKGGKADSKKGDKADSKKGGKADSKKGGKAVKNEPESS